MKKYIYIFVFFFPSLLVAGEWVQVEGGAVEVDLPNQKVENDLWEYIKNVSNRKFEPKDKYTFQFKAVSNTVITINALCSIPGKRDLHKEFIVVFDGGSCFFQVNYNLKTGKFSKLQVNGEA